MTTITARERLINAAVEAFAEKGFAGTTTRDIASRFGRELDCSLEPVRGLELAMVSPRVADE